MQSYQWSALSRTQQDALLERPVQRNSVVLERQVSEIIATVKRQGDQALIDYTAKFDGVALENVRYSIEQIDAQADQLDAQTRTAIDTAYDTIWTFHSAQRPTDITVETRPGVVCEQKFTALDSVGLYIPGGSATLPSTALMLGVPAKIAECRRVVLVSPPNQQGELSPALMYVAQKCGIREVYRVGGAQAIAALAFGTESIASVNKVFGPGNSYVTAAKQQVSQASDGAAMDMPAGPSELMVIADEKANPAFVAADLLSQAEHGPDSQVLLLTPSAAMAAAVQAEVEKQLATLSRASIANQALGSSSLIQVDDLAQAIAISQRYAPEHLSLQLRDAKAWLPELTTAGSIFVGDYTPESGGDYATGTNHVLPTYGYASTYSSLGLLDFYRRFTVQTASKDGLASLSAAITRLAEVEGLDAHKRAVTIRLEEQP